MEAHVPSHHTGSQQQPQASAHHLCSHFLSRAVLLCYLWLSHCFRSSSVCCSGMGTPGMAGRTHCHGHSHPCCWTGCGGDCQPLGSWPGAGRSWGRAVAAVLPLSPAQVLLAAAAPISSGRGSLLGLFLTLTPPGWRRSANAHGLELGPATSWSHPRTSWTSISCTSWVFIRVGLPRCQDDLR